MHTVHSELYQYVLSGEVTSASVLTLPQSRSKCDLYKQLLNLKVQNITVQLVENSGYRGTMPDTGHSIRLHTEASR